MSAAGAGRGAERADGDEEKESLKDALQQALDEARMVLPGIQALFGFQLIAVFNDGFGRLSEGERLLHLAAILLVTVAIALVMTPAAYHRQVGRRRATAEFLALASRFISAAMLPLAAGIALDVHLVGRLIIGQAWASGIVAGALFLGFVLLWFVYPLWQAARSARRGRVA
jgi:Family of unknown function (DUF6328)